MDAVVNPILIEDASNARYQSQDCPLGEVRVLPPVEGSFQVVIEVVGPMWQGDYQEEEELASCYRRAMDMAKRQNFRNIACADNRWCQGFPANRPNCGSAGGFGTAPESVMESVIFCSSDP